MGIEHRYTTLLWPRANSEVERQNRSLLKSMRAAYAEGKNWREELNRFFRHTGPNHIQLQERALLSYRLEKAHNQSA